MPEFKEIVEFEGCSVRHETTSAVLVDGLEEQAVWIPKSQIDDRSEVWNNKDDGRGPGRLVISEWIAKEKGLI